MVDYVHIERKWSFNISWKVGMIIRYVYFKFQLLLATDRVVHFMRKSFQSFCHWILQRLLANIPYWRKFKPPNDTESIVDFKRLGSENVYEQLEQFYYSKKRDQSPNIFQKALHLYMPQRVWTIKRLQPFSSKLHDMSAVVLLVKLIIQKHKNANWIYCF